MPTKSYSRPHFLWSELECNCGCGARWISNAALDKLEELRLRIGQPIIVWSAARCPFWNAHEGGAPLSQHRSVEDRPATAFDIAITPQVSKEAIVSTAEALDFRGIGKNYSSFVHIDDRSYYARW